MREKIADLLTASIIEHEIEVRNINFWGADMEGNSFAWQMVSFVWGAEKEDHNYLKSKFGLGISDVVNSTGDYVQFIDLPINGEMVHHYYFNRQNVTNVFLDIAKGNTEHFSDNDKALAADMVRKGYVISNDNGLFVNAPVFTKEQYIELKNIFAETAYKIADEAEILMDTITKILKNHIPVHLKKLAKDMSYLRLLEDAISAPIAILYDRKYLLPYNGVGFLPTTYVILNK